jgi:hypothetical protein
VRFGWSLAAVSRISNGEVAVVSPEPTGRVKASASADPKSTFVSCLFVIPPVNKLLTRPASSATRDQVHAVGSTPLIATTT